MTLSSTAVYQQFNGNGSVTSFSVTAFQWWEIEVVHIGTDGTETVWVEGTQYDLLDEDANPMTGGDGRKGTVVVSESPTDYTPASGEKLRVWRITDRSQEVAFVENDNFPSATMEDSLDRLAMQVQELETDIKRAAKISKADHVTLAGAALTLPTPDAGKVLVWNDDEDGLDNQTSPADAVTAAEAAQAAAETAQTAAETAETNAETAATNASTSATNAATSATNAATSATAAQTAETNAETAETNAESAQTAAEAAQAAAEAAQTAAETAETNAETAATNASNSASAASTSASNASTSETNAATSETNAGNSATAAQTAETNAETAETNAEAAQAAAEAARDLAIAASENPALTYLFDNATADADPGAGEFRFNNGTLASVTTVFLDNADDDGNTVSGFIDAFDDTGDAGARGYLFIKGIDTPATFFVGLVTGSVVDGTGYRKVSVTHVASGGTFTATERFSVLFGPAGPGGGDASGPASAVDGNIAVFDDTTGKLLADGGINVADLLTEAEASAAYQPLDTQLTEWAGVDPSDDGKSLVSAANYAAMRGLLDLEPNTDFYAPGGTDVAVADGGTGRSSHTAYAVLCGGTTGTGAQQSIASVGTASQVLTSNGAGALPTFQDAAGGSGITPATVQASTSGSSITFSSLPAGLNRITVIFNGVSISGTDDFLVQLGDSGGVEATGYVSVAGTVESGGTDVATYTTGFGILAGDAGRAISGHVLLTRITGNVWIASGTIGSSAVSYVCMISGSKTLSAELDRVVIDTNGTNTFDAGQINLFYE